MNTLLLKSLPILIVIFFIFLQNFLEKDISKKILIIASYVIVYCSLSVKKPYMNIFLLFVIGLFIDSISGITVGFSSFFMLLNMFLIRYQESTFKLNNNIISVFLLFIANMLIMLFIINILYFTVDFKFINSFDFIKYYTMLFVIIRLIFFVIYEVILN